MNQYSVNHRTYGQISVGYNSTTGEMTYRSIQGGSTYAVQQNTDMYRTLIRAIGVEQPTVNPYNPQPPTPQNRTPAAQTSTKSASFCAAHPKYATPAMPSAWQALQQAYDSGQMDRIERAKGFVWHRAGLNDLRTDTLSAHLVTYGSFDRTDAKLISDAFR